MILTITAQLIFEEKKNIHQLAKSITENLFNKNRTCEKEFEFEETGAKLTMTFAVEHTSEWEGNSAQMAEDAGRGPSDCNHEWDSYEVFEACSSIKELLALRFNPNFPPELKKVAAEKDGVVLELTTEGYSCTHFGDYSWATAVSFTGDNTYDMLFFAGEESAERYFKFADRDLKIPFAIFGTLFYTESETFSDYIKENLENTKKYLSDTNNTAAAEKLRAMGYDI